MASFDTNLHYMKVLQKYYHHMQPEIREAIDYSILLLEYYEPIAKLMVEGDEK